MPPPNPTERAPLDMSPSARAGVYGTPPPFAAEERTPIEVLYDELPPERRWRSDTQSTGPSPEQTSVMHQATAQRITRLLRARGHGPMLRRTSGITPRCDVHAFRWRTSREAT